MAEDSCHYCNYTPGEFPRNVKKFLTHHGYEDDFISVPFGPEKEGNAFICPLCGSLVRKQEPEYDQFMIIRDAEDVTEDKLLGESLIVPHKKPADEEPRICSTCGDVIQPSDKHYIEPRDDGPFFLCSDECHEEWRDDYYD